MSKLFDKNQKAINTITTQDAYDYKDILKKLKDEAFKAPTKDITVKPDITTRQEAQDEADRLNQIYQAILGVKEGFKEKLCDSGGTDALSLVLQQADGQNKSITDYTLYELADARIAVAHCPNPELHPNNFIGCTDTFKTTSLELWTSIAKATRRYAMACALALGVDPDFFTTSLKEMDLCTLRFLHYPPLDIPSSNATDISREAIPVGEHTDFGFVTFLLLGEGAK